MCTAYRPIPYLFELSDQRGGGGGGGGRGLFVLIK